MADTIPFYIEQLLGFLTSPWSAVLLIIGFGIALVLLNVPNAKWWLLSVMLYSTTFGVVGLTEGNPNGFSDTASQIGRLAFPLNVIQNNARTLTIICIIFMLLPALTAPRGRRISFVTGAFLSFFMLEMWVCVRLSLDLTAVARSSLDFVVAMLMLATLVVGVGRWLQTAEDARALLKSIVGFGALFVLGNLYQIAMVPSTALQPRLAGTTPNAQSVGQIAAVVILPALFLAQDKLVTRGWRIVSLIVGGSTCVLLLWSGSRTGMMMTAMGVLFLFGTKLHRFIFPAIGLVIVLYVASILFPGAFLGVARFTDATNDRAGAWSWMIAQFLQNPVIGNSFNGMGYREGFFLATLAYYGAVGGVPVLLLVVFTIKQVLSLIRHRAALGSSAGLTSFLTAMFAMYAVGAIFESSLLGLLNIVTITLYLTFSLLAFSRDEVMLNENSAVYGQDPYAATYGQAPAFTDLSWY